jgi:hypothetical protein
MNSPPVKWARRLARDTGTSTRPAQAVLAAVLAVLGVGCIPHAASGAQLESGLVFRDERPVSLHSGEAKQARTAVLCNASSAAATELRWSLGGFEFENDGKAVGNGKVVSLTGTRSGLGPGSCDSATITVKAKPVIDAGPFSSQLVVTSAGGGIARLDISVAGPESAVVPTQGASATIELVATRKLLFSKSVSIDGGSVLALKAPPRGKSLEVAPPGAFIGNLVKGGDVASVFVTGKPEEESAQGVWLLPIEVRGVAHTGEYEGTLTPTASADETQTVKVKVAVTDWWPWAVLAVLLGAGIVVFPTLRGRRWRLESTLHDRHRALPTAYASAGRDFHTRFPAFPGIAAPSEDDVDRYAKEADIAIRAYAESTWYFDTTSDAYAKIIQSLDAAEADVACLGEASGLGKALTDLDKALRVLASALGAHLPIDRQPAIALAANALLQPGELAVGEATIRARKARESTEAIEHWTELAQILRRDEVWYRVLEELSAPGSGRNFSPEDFAALQEIYAAIGEVRNELLESVDAEAIGQLGISERLTHTYSQLAHLGAKYNVWVISEPPRADSEDAWPRLKLDKGGQLEDIPVGVRSKLADIREQLPNAVSDSASWRQNADVLKISAAKTVELGRTKRFIGDAMVVVLSVATGTVASLSAFYFGKTFGTVEDFLTVVFVGTAAQAFLKPVTDTLAQLRGSTEPVTKSDPQKAAATTVAKAAS